MLATVPVKITETQLWLLQRILPDHYEMSGYLLKKQNI